MARQFRKVPTVTVPQYRSATSSAVKYFLVGIHFSESCRLIAYITRPVRLRARFGAYAHLRVRPHNGLTCHGICYVLHVLHHVLRQFAYGPGVDCKMEFHRRRPASAQLARPGFLDYRVVRRAHGRAQPPRCRQRSHVLRRDRPAGSIGKVIGRMMQPAGKSYGRQAKKASSVNRLLTPRQFGQ
jgi:hypothetical protein